MTAHTPALGNLHLDPDFLCPLPAGLLDKREVADRFATARPRDIGNFVLKQERFVLDDDSIYDTQIFRPLEPQFDIPVTYTTPWCTDLKGFNQLYGEQLAINGIHVVAVSPERMPWKRLVSGQPLSLEHDVHAQHAILNAVESGFGGQPAYPFTPGVAVSAGYSRGAMIGFGVNRYSHMYGRDIRYSEYIDPCLEHKVELKDVDARKLPLYLAQETATLFQHLADYGMVDQANLALHALRRPAKFWLQQVLLAKTLFNGEAGTFVRDWHPDTEAHIGLFDRSIFNHADEWQARFQNFPNVSITRESGRHLSGACKQVQTMSVGRIVRKQYDLRDQI